jgi:hypothetical protein
MPRTKKNKTSTKSKSSKSKTPKSKKTKTTKTKETTNPYQNIINVINSLSNSRNKHSFSKSRNNLPAQLMTIDKKNTKTSKHSSKPQVFNRTFKSSSSFSSITQNGETHSKGKKVINNSLNPFIVINEMKNGDVQHYIIPKNSLSQSYAKSHSNKKKSKSTKRKTIKRKSTKRKTIKRKSTKRKTKTSKKSNSKSKSKSNN